MNYEIEWRKDAYWIVDELGVLNGPYSSVEEARKDVPKSGQLQFPLEMVRDSII